MSDDVDQTLREYLAADPLNGIAVEAIAQWDATSLAHQKQPPGDWYIWLMSIGRGGGKTRTGAQTVLKWGWLNPGWRILVTAPTHGDLLGVVFEGESGLLNVIPTELIEPTASGTLYNRSELELRLKNGTLIKGISGERVDRFRGTQWNAGWIDEFSSFQRDKDAMQMIDFTMRLGKKPRMIITTTPKPKLTLRELMKRDGKDVVVTRGSTYDNIQNLAPSFQDAILQYEGTAIGRQEIYAEMVDPSENGIIRQSWLRMWPASKPLPPFRYIVMSLDTAYTDKTHDKRTYDRDPTACSVWGLFLDNKQPKIMLLDAWEDMLGMPELIKRVKKEKDTHYGTAEKSIIEPLFGPKTLPNSGRQPDLVLIEDVGSGKSLRQMLAAEGVETYPYNPSRASKVERLHAVSHIFSNGLVYIPESQKKPGEFISWAAGLIEQLTTFVGEGSTPHDDLLDSTTQAIRVIFDMKLVSVTGPKQITIPEDEREWKPKRGNPYAA